MILRAAILLSLFFVICGVAAALGFPTVTVDSEAVTGARGLAIGLTLAVLPPLIVRMVKRFRKRGSLSQT
jgi:hypothetical protein